MIGINSESSLNDYNIIQKIGYGSFATVYEAIHVDSNKKVAIKKISKCDFSKLDNKETVLREIKIMRCVDHPLIVHIFDAFEDDESIFIVMELCEGLNLLEIISKYGHISEDKSRFLFHQLISIIDYLHNTLKVIHRDLKAENIIISSEGTIKLIDFGLSSVVGNDLHLKTVCGSPAYAAPEIFKRTNYTSMVDIWSCGVILYAMTVGCLPFYDTNFQKQVNMVINEDPSYPTSISPSLSFLLKRLLNKNPDERITLNEIKSVPWYSYGNMNLNGLRSSQFKMKTENLMPEILGLFDQMKIDYNYEELLDDINITKFTKASVLYRIIKTGIINRATISTLNQIMKNHNAPHLNATTSLNVRSLPQSRVSLCDISKQKGQFYNTVSRFILSNTGCQSAHRLKKLRKEDKNSESTKTTSSIVTGTIIKHTAFRNH